MSSVNVPIFDASHEAEVGSEGIHKKRTRSLLTLVLWFIIIAVIAWIVLWSWSPKIVQKTDSQGKATGEPDGSKVLVGAVIVGLLAVIIIYLLWYCCA